MKLPIVYPKDEYPAHSMDFLQWKYNQSVIPSTSEVVILDEEEKHFRVFITGVKLVFNIPKSQCLVVENGHPLEEYGFTL